MVEGILVVDRYSAYTAYARRNDEIVLALRWSHARRDFREAELKYKAIEQWAQEWVQRINELFHLNAVRCRYALGTGEFARADEQLYQAVDRMKDALDQQRRRKRLHHAQTTGTG